MVKCYVTFNIKLSRLDVFPSGDIKIDAPQKIHENERVKLTCTMDYPKDPTLLEKIGHCSLWWSKPGDNESSKKKVCISLFDLRIGNTPYKAIIHRFLQLKISLHFCAEIQHAREEEYIYSAVSFQILKDDEDVTILVMHGKDQRPESSTLTIPRMRNMWEGRYSCHVWCVTVMETGTITLTITPGESYCRFEVSQVLMALRSHFAFVHDFRLFYYQCAELPSRNNFKR